MIDDLYDRFLTLHILSKRPLVDFVDDLPVVIIEKTPMPFNVFTVLVTNELYRLSSPKADPSAMEKSVKDLWCRMSTKRRVSTDRPMAACQRAITTWLFRDIERTDIIAIAARVKSIDEEYARIVMLRHNRLAA